MECNRCYNIPKRGGLYKASGPAASLREVRAVIGLTAGILHERFLEPISGGFTSREFLITSVAGVSILLSALLHLAGAGFRVHTGFALAAVSIGGAPILIGAILGLVRRQVNVDELVTIAIVASVICQEYLSAVFVAFMR